MKTLTYTKTIVSYDELTPEQKEKALDKYRDWHTSDGCEFWHECITDEAKEIGKLLGFRVENVYFSGFWSQGDGACIVGDFSYPGKSIIKAIKEYAPVDKELHRIAKECQNLFAAGFYGVYGSIKHSGHYYHERSMDVDCWAEKGAADYKEWKEVIADFSLWIYKSLEKEYEYLNGDEAVAEALRANDMEFEVDEDGDLVF